MGETPFLPLFWLILILSTPFWIEIVIKKIKDLFILLLWFLEIRKSRTTSGWHENYYAHPKAEKAPPKMVVDKTSKGKIARQFDKDEVWHFLDNTSADTTLRRTIALKSNFGTNMMQSMSLVKAYDYDNVEDFSRVVNDIQILYGYRKPPEDNSMWQRPVE